MTTPPDGSQGCSDADPGRWASAGQPPGPSEPVSFDKAEAPFDPYRFGAPEHPVPAEYAPLGYTPPPGTAPPPSYATGQPGPGYPGPGNPGPGYPGPGYPGPGVPGPGYAYQPPPNYAQPYPQPRTGNGKAIAALVLGVLAIVLCWTSIFDVVLVALAVIFGFLGLSDAKRGGGGRGMAISAIACALVGAILATVLTVVIFQRIKPCLDNYHKGSSLQSSCIRDRL